MVAQQSIEPENNIAKWLSLPTAYQRLGSAEYVNWRNYHIAEPVEGVLRLFDLNKFVQHNLKTPEFFAINMAEAINYSVPFIGDIDVQEHERIKRLLLHKIIGWGEVDIVCINKSNGSKYTKLDYWNTEAAINNCSIIESSIVINDGSTSSTYSVLIEPNKFNVFTDDVLKYRKKREADAKRTGRPPSPNKGLIIDVVEKIKKQFPNEENDTFLADKAHELLKAQGINTPDADGLRVYF